MSKKKKKKKKITCHSCAKNHGYTQNVSIRKKTKIVMFKCQKPPAELKETKWDQNADKSSIFDQNFFSPSCIFVQICQSLSLTLVQFLTFQKIFSYESVNFASFFFMTLKTFQLLKRKLVKIFGNVSIDSSMRT